MNLWSEREYGVRVDAPSTVAWSLVARPDRWHEWAPHVRGAWHLGDPEVQQGRVGAARLVPREGDEPDDGAPDVLSADAVRSSAPAAGAVSSAR